MCSKRAFGKRGSQARTHSLEGKFGGLENRFGPSFRTNGPGTDPGPKLVPPNLKKRVGKNWVGTGDGVGARFVFVPRPSQPGQGQQGEGVGGLTEVIPLETKRSSREYS